MRQSKENTSNSHFSDDEEEHEIAIVDEERVNSQGRNLTRENCSVVFNDFGVETVNFVDSHELFEEGVDVVMLGE
jgi:hypothetical protein